MAFYTVIVGFSTFMSIRERLGFGKKRLKKGEKAIGYGAQSSRAIIKDRQRFGYQTQVSLGLKKYSSLKANIRHICRKWTNNKS